MKRCSVSILSLLVSLLVTSRLHASELSMNRYIGGAALATISPLSLLQVAPLLQAKDAGQIAPFIPLLIWSTPSLGLGQNIQGRRDAAFWIRVGYGVSIVPMTLSLLSLLSDWDNPSSTATVFLILSGVLYGAVRLFEIGDAWIGPHVDGSLGTSSGSSESAATPGPSLSIGILPQPTGSLSVFATAQF